MAKVNTKTIAKLNDAITILKKNRGASIHSGGISFAEMTIALLHRGDRLVVGTKDNTHQVSCNAIRVSKTRISFGSFFDVPLTRVILTDVEADRDSYMLYMEEAEEAENCGYVEIILEGE